MRSFWAGKNEFSCKKTTQSVFKYFNYLPSDQKSEKTIEPFLRKMPNWHTDRKRWFYRILRRTGVQKTKLTQGYLSLFAREKFSLENWQWYLNYISLSGYNCPSVFEFPRSVLFLWPHHHSPRCSSKSLRNFREIGTMKRTITQLGKRPIKREVCKLWCIKKRKGLGWVMVRLKNSLNIFIESNPVKCVQQLHLSLSKRDEFKVQYDKYFQRLSYFAIYFTSL